MLFRKSQLNDILLTGEAHTLHTLQRTPMLLALLQAKSNISSQLTGVSGGGVRLRKSELIAAYSLNPSMKYNFPCPHMVHFHIWSPAFLAVFEFHAICLYFPTVTKQIEPNGMAFSLTLLCFTVLTNFTMTFLYALLGSARNNTLSF